MADQIQVRPFTTKYQGMSNKLKNKVKIRKQSDPSKSIEVEALWDTGATNSCISHDVVRELELIPSGYCNVKTPSGQQCYPLYDVSLILPNMVIVEGVRAIESEIGEQKIDLLVGMDIILEGDFAVSNYNGKTTFTFRIPSQKEIDFVATQKLHQIIGPRHGQGQRKRRT